MKCGRMSIFVHVYSVRFKCLLNVFEGFSDSKTLGAGRLDINIDMQIYISCIIDCLPPLVSFVERPV